MRTWVLMLAGALALASCASTPRTPDRRAALARQIADDAASFNEAYAQAVSGQILLNILRSRDRLPRYYLATTGISDNPSWTYSQGVGIGGLPLGGGGTPIGIGSIAAEREQQTRPGYAVQPFDAPTLARTAFESTSTETFAHYWRSGWPRDLLLLMMVEAIESTDANNHTYTFINEANTIFDDCVEAVQTEGCAFVREVRGFLAAASEHPRQRGYDAERGRSVCGLIDAYGAATPVRAAPPREHEVCDPIFVVGDRTVRLRLRSLDDMIYYVGELLRAGSMRAGAGQPIEAQVTVAAAGLRGGGRGVPLFRVLPEHASAHGMYAAEVVYGGARYRAGPAIGRSCGVEASAGPCRDGAAEGDRSSSVLSLIAEILALNQSPESIRAPQRLIAE
ncbi:MAG: hypothetical protein JNK94_00955 [Hyphomonadaceae bacterium]|nr:hypothetical protein [Hyphomonadaceae bacterium]